MGVTGPPMQRIPSRFMQELTGGFTYFPTPLEWARRQMLFQSHLSEAEFSKWIKCRLNGHRWNAPEYMGAFIQAYREEWDRRTLLRPAAPVAMSGKGLLRAVGG